MSELTKNQSWFDADTSTREGRAVRASQLPYETTRKTEVGEGTSGTSDQVQATLENSDKE